MTKTVFSLCKLIPKDWIIRDYLSGIWGSHEQGVHSSQDTSHMGTARVKQEEEADKNGKKNRKAFTRAKEMQYIKWCSSLMATQKDIIFTECSSSMAT